MHKHAGAIEADFQRFYGLDLWGDVPPLRRVRVLIEHLPREAALWREIHGEAATWGPTEHLLAVAVDVLQGANWQRAGKKSAPRPKPIERPRSKLHDDDTLARLKDARARSERARRRRRSGTAEREHQTGADHGGQKEQRSRPARRRVGSHRGSK